MGLAGRNSVFQESSLNGIRTEAFVNQPVIQVLHNRGFGLANFQALRRGVCLPNVAISIGWILSPIHPSLTSGEKTPTTRPFIKDSPFVFSKDALDLEQHLLFWTLPKRVIEKDHFTPGSFELFEHDHLIGVVPG